MGNVLYLNNKEQETTMSDVTYLRAVTGGKEPPADGDWLSLLDVGTIFLVQRKQNTGEFALGEFILVDKDLSLPKVVIVMSGNAPGKRICWNPTRFCSQFSHYKTLGIVEIPGEIPKEEGKEDEDHRVEHTAPEAT